MQLKTMLWTLEVHQFDFITSKRIICYW